MGSRPFLFGCGPFQSQTPKDFTPPVRRAFHSQDVLRDVGVPGGAFGYKFCMFSLCFQVPQNQMRFFGWIECTCPFHRSWRQATQNLEWQSVEFNQSVPKSTMVFALRDLERKCKPHKAAGLLRSMRHSPGPRYTPGCRDAWRGS